MKARWERFCDLVHRWRFLFLGLSVVVTVGGAVSAPTIPFVADVTEYMPSKNPAVAFWLDMTHKFGALNVLMVGLEEPGRPFQADSLARLRAMTDSLAERKAEGILVARSLTNMTTLREDEESGTLHAETLVAEIPATPEALESLGHRVLADANVKGSFVSHDLSAYVLLLTVDERKDAREVADLVRAIVESQRGPMRAVYFGAPFISGMITSRVYESLLYVAPLFVVLLLGTLFLRTRRLWPGLTVLLCSGLSLVWWLGLVRLAGIELTASASSAILLVLVLAAAVFGKGCDGWLRRQVPAAALPGRMLALLAGAAAALGLLSFSSIPFLARLGQAAMLAPPAIALCGAFLLLPLATFLRARPAAGPVALPGGLLVKTNVAFIMVSVVVLGATVGAAHIRFLISPRDMFLATDEVGEAIAFFDRRFHGADILQIHARGDFSQPADCARLMRLTDLLEGSPLLSDVRSLSQILAFLNQQFGGEHRIPSSAGTLANLWFFLEGNEDIRPLVLADRREAMIAARILPDTELDPSTWTATAQQLVEQSRRTGPEAARLRLSALGRKLATPIGEATVEKAVSLLAAPEEGPAKEDRTRRVLSTLQDYMKSPESPFEPAAAEWDRMAAALAETGPEREPRLVHVVAGLDSFKEAGYEAGVAAELAATLVGRFREEERLGRARDGLAVLVEGLAAEEVSPAFRARAEGILLDLLDPESQQEGQVAVTVSGLPAVVASVESDTRVGLWLAGAAIWAVLLLFFWLGTRNVAATARAGLEALLAALLTLAVGYVLNVQIDSACAALYLLPPLVAYVFSPWLEPAGEDGGLPVCRLCAALLVGLGLAGFSLFFTGVMPVIRLGAVMALGLLLTAMIGTLSARVRLT